MRRLLTIAVLCMGFVSAAPPALSDPVFLPARIELPTGFRPEGIEIGALPVAYIGSLATGAIYRADLRSGRGEVLSPGPGTPALGLRLDPHGRLFVAGGAGGDARVLDPGTGAVLATYRLASTPDSIVNDVTFTPEGAWFTDSRTPVLYHLPSGPDGVPPPADAVVRVPLTGDIRYVPEMFNANGIARTPDGSGLIIVQSVTGGLFRVDPATGRTRAIDLGGATAPHGDGMLLSGNTLFVVQNRLNAISVIALDDAGTTGTVRCLITDTNFDIPTTVAQHAGRLYLPNARFDIEPTPTTPYSVVAVRVTR